LYPCQTFVYAHPVVNRPVASFDHPVQILEFEILRKLLVIAGKSTISEMINNSLKIFAIFIVFLLTY